MTRKEEAIKLAAEVLRFHPGGPSWLQAAKRSILLAEKAGRTRSRPGRPVEIGPDTVRVTLRLRRDTVEKAEQEAEESGVTLSEVLRMRIQA